MKCIGILTAGGDTPALNATLHGAVTRANQLRVEVFGLVKGFNCLFQKGLPHVHLNPLYREIPELDPTKGGTILGASRDFIRGDDRVMLDTTCARLKRLGIEGLVCVGGDGTMNGLQPLCERIPVVLAPKTIDNDLGLNYPNEADFWMRTPSNAPSDWKYTRAPSRSEFDLNRMVNYVTPGYATAVYVSATGVDRIRTTAESHRRVAIVEVMGRHSGYIALGAAYGQPDIILVPECEVSVAALAERVREIYDRQGNVVIVCGEGVVDETGNVLGARRKTTDPAGNTMLTGASEVLRDRLIETLTDDYFRSRGGDSAETCIFTRKLGHTQRGGRPLQFDRFYAAQLGGKAVEMLLEGQNNALAILQFEKEKGFYVDACQGHRMRDQWGQIHARTMHPSFYDPVLMQPSSVGIDYLLPIFTRAIGPDDMEHVRDSLFDQGNLYRRYHSVNTDVQKRIRYLESDA